jgi:hypothetical protein
VNGGSLIAGCTDLAKRQLLPQVHWRLSHRLTTLHIAIESKELPSFWCVIHSILKFELPRVTCRLHRSPSLCVPLLPSPPILTHLGPVEVSRLRCSLSLVQFQFSSFNHPAPPTMLRCPHYVEEHSDQCNRHCLDLLTPEEGPCRLFEGPRFQVFRVPFFPFFHPSSSSLSSGLWFLRSSVVV